MARSVITFAIALCAACGSAELPREVVGDLSGTDAKAALVQNGSSIVAYICGGPMTLESHTRWFEGTVKDSDGFNLEKDGWTFIGQITEGGAIGVLTSTSGATADLIGRAARAELDQGLFGGEGSGRCRTGAIALDDPVTVQGAGCDSAGRVQQVTPDGPIESAGFPVKIGDRTETVRPVSL